MLCFMTVIGLTLTMLCSPIILYREHATDWTTEESVLHSVKSKRFLSAQVCSYLLWDLIRFTFCSGPAGSYSWGVKRRQGDHSPLSTGKKAWSLAYRRGGFKVGTYPTPQFWKKITSKREGIVPYTNAEN
jgi:hypothetical protein